jgi:hypothetical protein
MEKGVRFIGNGQAPVHMYWNEIMDMMKSGQVGVTLVLGAWQGDLTNCHSKL